MTIKLRKEASDRLAESIKRYFKEELEEDIGDLKSTLFLDFCLREIGPCIYNQAVADVQAVLQGRVTDLDSECFRAEFTYWKR